MCLLGFIFGTWERLDKSIRIYVYVRNTRSIRIYVYIFRYKDTYLSIHVLSVYILVDRQVVRGVVRAWGWWGVSTSVCECVWEQLLIATDSLIERMIVIEIVTTKIHTKHVNQSCPPYRTNWIEGKQSTDGDTKKLPKFHRK